MKSYIFAVDGTLTPSRGKIDEEFLKWFLEFVKWHNFSEDMERLEDDTSGGKQRIYENLQMKHADVKKYINEQKVRK